MPSHHDNPVRQLPHGPEFRFVTRVLTLMPGDRATGEWSLDGSEPFFRAHFPARPLVPGVLITEALAQLSGLVAFAGSGPPVPARLAHVDVRFDRAVEPPTTISLHSTITRRFGTLTQFEVEASVAGERAARGTVTLAAPPRSAPEEGAAP